LRDIVERVGEKKHLTAQIGRLRRNLAQRCPQAGMVVGDDKFDARKPRAMSLAGNLAGSIDPHDWYFDPPHLATAVPVDADRGRHRMADDHADLSNLLIPGVEDPIGSSDALAFARVDRRFAHRIGLLLVARGMPARYQVAQRRCQVVNPYRRGDSIGMSNACGKLWARLDSSPPSSAL
jgi:hypothetical protein